MQGSGGTRSEHRFRLVFAPFPGPLGGFADPSATLPGVPLSRIAWLVTVAASFIVAVLLLVSDYNGYALLAAAVGLSAAINLR